MRLFIPVVGTRLRLLESKTVSIKNTGQNQRFFDALTNEYSTPPSDTIQLTLPKGAELIVDRVYVRQGDGAEFNSLTFKIDKKPDVGLPKGRFFLPVDVVNSLDVDVLIDKPASENKNVRYRLNELYKSMTVNQRVDDEHLTRLASEVRAMPSIVSGKLCYRIKDELARFKDELLKHLNYAGFDSEEALRSSFREEATEILSEIDEHYQLIEEQIKSCPFEALYAFRVVIFGGEPAIELTVVETDILPKFQRLHHLYQDIFKKVDFTDYGLLVKVCIRSWETLVCHVKVPRAECDHFGFHYYKDNHTPKRPIVVRHNGYGIIPLDAFGDNLFTRAKNSGYEHELVYITEDDQEMTPAELRRAINQACKGS